MGLVITNCGGQKSGPKCLSRQPTTDNRQLLHWRRRRRESAVCSPLDVLIAELLGHAIVRLAVDLDVGIYEVVDGAAVLLGVKA